MRAAVLVLVGGAACDGVLAPCADMCAAAVPAFEACLAESSVTYADAGYADAADFEETCRTWTFGLVLLADDLGARTGAAPDVAAICDVQAAGLQPGTCDSYRQYDWAGVPWD